MREAICGSPACRRIRRGPIRIGNVLVYDPSGRLLGKILLPERALNVGFGGADWKTLYITATTSVYRVKTRYGGIPHPTTRTQGPPAITANGVVNSSARGSAISPGSIVEIYGSNMAIASCAVAHNHGRYSFPAAPRA